VAVPYPPTIYEYSLKCKTCVRATQAVLRSNAPMFRQIFTSITAVTHSLEECVEALQAIVGRLDKLEGAIGQFELPTVAPPEPVEDPRVAGLLARMDDLTTAVADGVNRVQRSENRVRSIIQGARKELADAGLEHPGIEAEAGQLQPVDGTGGEPEPVPALPTDVEDPERPSSIPGVTVGQIARARVNRR